MTYEHQRAAFVADVVGVIEATDFERHCLYERWTAHGAKWESRLDGWFEQVGLFGGMPTTISLWTATINGRKILFFDSPSQVCDHRLIDSWLENNLPASARCNDGTGLNRTDANNSHIVLK